MTFTKPEVPRRLAGSASAPTLKAPRLSRPSSDKGPFTSPSEPSRRTTVRDGVRKEQTRHLFRGTAVSARALRPSAAPPDNAAAQPLQRARPTSQPSAKRALAREERISARYLVLDAGCDLPKLSYQTPTSALPSPFCSSSRRV
eukprot:s547_g13.t1